MAHGGLGMIWSGGHGKSNGIGIDKGNGAVSGGGGEARCSQQSGCGRGSGHILQAGSDWPPASARSRVIRREPGSTESDTGLSCFLLVVNSIVRQRESVVLSFHCVLGGY